MSSSTREPAKIGPQPSLTVSDSSARGERDRSFPARRCRGSQEKQLCGRSRSEIVPDEQPAIQKAILRLVEKARLVVTTGGTGIAQRDVTPEATRAVCDRLLEGVAERMRFGRR